MKTYYFVCGKFQPVGMGFNYNDSKIGIRCIAESFSVAKQKVIDFCTIHFGEAYKQMDMWYGQYAYPWNFEPVTEWFFYNDPRTNNYEKDYDI